MNVNFQYSQDVFSPKHLAGKKDEKRDLEKSDAEELQRLGYGRIIETEDRRQKTGDRNDARTKTEPSTRTKT